MEALISNLSVFFEEGGIDASIWKNNGSVESEIACWKNYQEKKKTTTTFKVIDLDKFLGSQLFLRVSESYLL